MIMASNPLHGLWTLTDRELKKWYKAPVVLIVTLIQPIVWLAFFGKSMNMASIFTSGSVNIPGLNIPKQIIDQIAQAYLKSTFGTTDYFSFLAASMVAQITFFTAMNSGMSIVWDRRLGVLDKLLTTPVPRGSIIMGKVLNSVLRSLAQATIVLIIATLLGMKFNTSLTPLGFALSIVGVYAALTLLALGFSALYLTLALRSTNWQSQMAIINLLNMPLMFASNSFYPIKMMPWWLRPIAYINPLTYVNDVTRGLLLGISTFSVPMDFLYLAVFAIAFSAIGIVLSWRFLSEG
jgi:ABC-2 type transport system permease protein